MNSGHGAQTGTVVLLSLARHMRKEYLPDRSFQQIQSDQPYTSNSKTPPSYMPCWPGAFHEDYDAIRLMNTFGEYDGDRVPVMTILCWSPYIRVGCSRSMRRLRLYNENKQDRQEDSSGICQWLAEVHAERVPSFVDVWPRLSGERLNRRRGEGRRNIGRPRVSRYIPYGCAQCRT